jgi:dTDP-glucose pyrophosphorylase
MKKDNLNLWRKTLAFEESTLGSIIEQLNDSGLQIVLVVSRDEVLIGTITDGDIRRGLLRGLDMNSGVEAIVNRDAMVAPNQMSRDSAKEFMRVNKIHALPILNDSRQVVGMYMLNELLKPEDRDILMIIMAGGQGTRLKPHTENCPKPMIPVGGKPMLEHIIERAKAQGVRHFILSIHYLGHVIQNYFGDGSRWQVEIEYLSEDYPLGTAGAIGLITDRPKKPFLVTNGDVISDIPYCDLLDFHIHQQAIATMAVRAHEWQHPFGVVESNGVEYVGFAEKPISRSQINAGVYALHPDSLDVLKKGIHCDMPELFERLTAAGKRTVIYPMHEPWLDVGKPDDLKEAQMNVLREPFK